MKSGGRRPDADPDYHSLRLLLYQLIRPTVRKKIKKPTLRVLTLPHAPRCGYLPFPPSFSEQIRRIGKVSPAQAQWGGVQKVQQWKTMFGVVCVPPPAVNAWWTLSPALTKSSSCSFVPRTHSQEPSRRATTAPTARATLRWQRDVLACGCNGSRTRGSRPVAALVSLTQGWRHPDQSARSRRLHTALPSP